MEYASLDGIYCNNVYIYICMYVGIYIYMEYPQSNGLYIYNICMYALQTALKQERQDLWSRGSVQNLTNSTPVELQTGGITSWGKSNTDSLANCYLTIIVNTYLKLYW